MEFSDKKMYLKLKTVFIFIMTLFAAAVPCLAVGGRTWDIFVHFDLVRTEVCKWRRLVC